MRISDRDLAGLAGAETARSQEMQRTERGDGSGASLRGGPQGDRVEFSAGLGQLARAISSFGADRSTYVQSLATLYQSGGYQTDSLATGQAMVSEALSAGIS